MSAFINNFSPRFSCVWGSCTANDCTESVKSISWFGLGGACLGLGFFFVCVFFNLVMRILLLLLLILLFPYV